MEKTDNGQKLGYRHVQVGLLLLMLAIGIGMRVHLSVAIVAMVDNTTSSNPDVPTYKWSNKNLILSSFYWGYVCLQVVVADLGRKYGPKRFLLGAMSINSTAMCLIPVIASKFGSSGVIVCRVVMGLAQGCFYCNIHNTLTKWIPVSERTRLTSLALSGAALGTIFTMPIVGYISSSSLGWPFANYLYGGFGFTWVVIYFVFGTSTPREHRSISEAELNFIESFKEPIGKKPPTPWKSIVTSVPIWAVLCSQVGTVWGYNTLLSEIPTYMNKIIGFNMKQNGLLSAIPYLTNFIMTYVFSYLSDYLINNNIISTTWCRKCASTIATLIPAASFLILGFLSKSGPTVSVLLLVTAVGAQSAATSGYMVNHLDLSPNFAGIIMAMCNSSSNFISIFAPILVQIVVDDESDISEWRIIFTVAAVMLLIPNIFYLFYGSAEIQPWDSVSSEEKKAIQERNKKMSVISIMSL
nr:putative inorganic phosphate cotransporter [Leptinotarsa decemlineata]